MLRTTNCSVRNDTKRDLARNRRSKRPRFGEEPGSRRSIAHHQATGRQVSLTILLPETTSARVGDYGRNYVIGFGGASSVGGAGASAGTGAGAAAGAAGAIGAAQVGATAVQQAGAGAAQVGAGAQQVGATGATTGAQQVGATGAAHDGATSQQAERRLRHLTRFCLPQQSTGAAQVGAGAAQVTTGAPQPQLFLRLNRPASVVWAEAQNTATAAAAKIARNMKTSPQSSGDLACQETLPVKAELRQGASARETGITALNTTIITSLLTAQLNITWKDGMSNHPALILYLLKTSISDSGRFAEQTTLLNPDHSARATDDHCSQRVWTLICKGERCPAT